MSDDCVTATRPWYRQPLVWMLIAIPGSSVLAGIVMLVLAAASYDGLVVDDYYKRGMEINRELERDRAATQLGLSAAVAFDVRTLSIEAIVLSRDPQVLWPDRLTLRMVHPTRSGLDQAVELRLYGGGRYRGSADRLEAGRWHLHLETKSWRIVGRMPVPGAWRSELSPAM